MRFVDDAKTVVVVATGPSAQPIKTDHPVIAVNDAYRICPNAAMLYAADLRWWDYHIGEVRKTFRGDLWTCDLDAAKKHNLNIIQGYNRPGISDRVVIHYNLNSGAQAINLAVVWGAKRIYLLGFDFQPVAEKRHFFGDHPQQINRPFPWQKALDRMPQIAADLKRFGVECFNLSRHSAIKEFPPADIESLYSHS